MAEQKTSTFVGNEKRRAIEDSFIRLSLLLEMAEKEIDVHTNSDFDRADALIHSARNEVMDLENMVFPEALISHTTIQPNLA